MEATTMKKCLAIVLTVILLLSYTAYAKVNHLNYVSSTGEFSFEYPEGYIPVNSLTVSDVLNVPGVMERFEALGIGEVMFALIADNKYEELFTPEYTGRASFTINNTSYMNMGILRMVGRYLLNDIIKNYIASGVNEDNIESMGFVVYGPNTYMGIKVDLKKSHIKQYLTCTNDGTLIYITFTNYDDLAIDLILRTMDFDR